ncbi:sugar transferase [Ornithinibacillus sp. 179-J 7C1 HS]|uniref:sugar transferase n=1 Tax=Ornithinibacillus sp. 179-J 7C1 HS TaxID=3142384 RepID=UPI0039A0A67F
MIQPNYKQQLNIFIFLKRIIDISFAVFCLPFAILLIGIFSILIKLESPGPLFYIQERVGQYGRYFKVYKLRSMFIDAEKDGPKWALEKDPRVTKVGRFMRRTKIDELPQFINILRGEMSLIGPRPERPIFTAEFEEKYPGFTKRLLVKPGLTGLAQVSGGYNISPKVKLNLDLYYIEKMGIKLDMQILFKTIKVVCSGYGSR